MLESNKHSHREEGHAAYETQVGKLQETVEVQKMNAQVWSAPCRSREGDLDAERPIVKARIFATIYNDADLV